MLFGKNLEYLAHKQCLVDEFLSFYNALFLKVCGFVNKTLSAKAMFSFLSLLTELYPAYVL